MNSDDSLDDPSSPSLHSYNSDPEAMNSEFRLSTLERREEAHTREHTEVMCAIDRLMRKIEVLEDRLGTPSPLPNLPLFPPFGATPP